MRRGDGRSDPATLQFTRHVNAADLASKYLVPAGHGEAGTAFGKNPPFLSDGAVFKGITAKPEDGQAAFGVADLYACSLLEEAADRYEFVRGGQMSRRQSRFIFYLVVVNLLRDVLNKGQRSADDRSVSLALAHVLRNEAANDARSSGRP